jgi:peptide/nickel transport system substrate-binding protein
VFERFDAYMPRSELTSWYAGGKRMATNRIEFVVIADPATAAAALQSGEVEAAARIFHAGHAPLY